MNLIEKFATLNRLAEAYGAHTDIDLIKRKSVIVTLKDGPHVQELVRCFCLELVNWGVFGDWEMETAHNKITIAIEESKEMANDFSQLSAERREDRDAQVMPEEFYGRDTLSRWEEAGRD